MNKPQRELDLQEILLYLWRHALVLLLCMAVAAAALAGLTVYQSRNLLPWQATALLSFDPPAADQASDAGDRFAYYNNFASTANVIVQSDEVLSAVADQLSLPVSQIQGHVSVSAVSNSAFLQLSVTGADEETTRRICEAVLAAAPEAGARMTDLGTLRAVSAVTVTPVSGSSPVKSALIGALLGAILGMAVLVALELLDNKLHDAGDVAYSLDLPVLGVIPADGSKAAAQQGEAWRAVRTALPQSPAASLLLVAGTDEAPVLADGEQLARALAQPGQRVLLVDGDCRHAGNEPGLSDLLTSPQPSGALPVTGPEDGVCRLAFGHGVESLPDLLAAPAAQEVLAELCRRYDRVLVAVPSAASRADAAAWSGFAAGAVLVVRADRTPIESARLAREKLSGAPLWGAVLTGYAWEKALRRDGYYYALTKAGR